MPARHQLARAVLPRPRIALPPIALVPVGATFGLIGDGIMSEAAAVAERNAGGWFLALMGMRLQPVPAWNLSQSGTMIARGDGGTNYPWITTAVSALAAQKPDVAIFGSCGHNDNVLASDPIATPGWLQDWKDAVSAHVRANPQALLIPVLTTFPSLVAGETTLDAGQVLMRRQRVTVAQLAHIVGLADPRLVPIDLSALDPSALSPGSDTLKVHPDDRGAVAIAALMVAAIGPRVAAATRVEIQAMIDGGTYPLMGTQLDPDRAFAGGSGTLTSASGTLATSKTVSNATGGNVAVAMQTGAGGRQKAVLTLSGTTTTEGSLLFGDKSNLTATGATPGCFVMSAWGLKLPASLAGLYRLGADWSGGNFGIAFAGAAAGASSALSGQLSAPLDLVLPVPARPVFGTTPPAATRRLGFRFKSGVTLAGTIEIDQPALWAVSNRTRHAPVYLGDLKPAGGGTALYGANLRMRATGTVTAAAGGTVRIEPGLCAPAGLTPGDFAQRRLYRGGAGDTAVGAGTLLATVAGATWTYTIAAGACAAGDLLYVEIDADNGIVPAATVRSALTLAVG